jgi:glycosyltransferase involved in cell wall biosynthesis
MKLSIIIPIYNEFHNIDEVISRIHAVELPTEIDSIEMILVDDGSNDGTSSKLDSYRNDETVVIHHSRINFGKGAATRIGLTYVSGDIILIQDADLEYDPNDYPLLLAPIVAGEAEIVYGSRFMKNPRPSGMVFKNYLANVILRIMTNVLYGAKLTDEATAYKMFRTPILQDIELRAKRFEFCPEVTAKVLKRGHKIVEVPISYHGRTVEEGKKIRWQDGVEAVWALLKFRFVD